MKNSTFLSIGLIGLGSAFGVNLIAVLFFKKGYWFTEEWWNSWFATYPVWIVFVIFGIADKLKRTNKT